MVQVRGRLDAAARGRAGWEHGGTEAWRRQTAACTHASWIVEGMPREHPDAIVARNAGVVRLARGRGNRFAGGWENGLGPPGGEDEAAVRGVRGRVVPEEELRDNERPPPCHQGDRNDGAHLQQRQLDKAGTEAAALVGAVDTNALTAELWDDFEINCEAVLGPEEPEDIPLTT